MANSIGLYTKAISAAVVAGLNSTITALTDGHIETAEWITIASVTLGALGAVWAVPNTPAKVQKYGKAITAAVVAGLGALLTVVLAGNSIDATAIFNIAVAVVTGLGLVHIAPNAQSSDDQYDVVEEWPSGENAEDEDVAEETPTDEEFEDVDDSDIAPEEVEPVEDLPVEEAK